MRTFRLLLLLVSLLLVFPAPVQAAGGRTVYLVLDEQTNFHLMLFNLIEAQDRGEIVSFEPYRSLGFLQVELPSAGLPASLIGFTLYNTKDSAFEAANQSALRPEGGGGSNLFQFYLWDELLSASNLPPNGRLTVKIYDGATVVATLDRLIDIYGSAEGYMHSTSYPPFVPGYKVVIKVYPPDSKTATTYVSKVPPFEIQKIIKQQATLAGVTAPGKLISSMVRHYYLESGHMKSVRVIRSGYAGSDGQWQLAFNDNLPPSDTDLSSQGGGYGVKSLTGGDRLDFTIHDSENISYQLRSINIPAVSCLIGSRYCLYYGARFTRITMTLEQGGIKHQMQLRTDRDGFAIARLPDGIYLQAGARVSATGADPLVIPEITVQLNRNTGVISGVGPANRWLNFNLSTLAGNEKLNFVTPTDKNKAYSYTSTNFLKNGAVYLASVTYFNPITGNNVFYKALFDDK